MLKRLAIGLCTAGPAAGAVSWRDTGVHSALNSVHFSVRII